MTPTPTDHRTLRVTAAPWAGRRPPAGGVASPRDTEAESGRIVSFENPAAIQRLLTPKRLELLKAVMESPPESMRQLSERLDRPPSEVHGDVHLLADSGVISIETVGRSKQPVVPYDRIVIEVELELPSGTPGSITTA